MQPAERKYRAVLLQANCDCDHQHRSFLESLWRNAGDTERVLEDIPYAIMDLNRPHGRLLNQDEDQRIETIHTLKWVSKNLSILRSMLTCANPKCATANKYFFHEKPRDEYCCDRCKAQAKEGRLMQRLISSGKYPEYKRSDEARQRMSDAAYGRWARKRGEATL